jgi:beta-lactam-binding protein with PASTA domain
MGRFFKGLGIFIALLGVGIVSAFAVVALLLRQEEVRVPDLTGQDIVSVLETMTQQGLLLKVDRREPHPTLPRDIVISQVPAPGSGIKKGRQVRVVVSQGPIDTQAPKLVGEHYRKADILVRQAGFSPGVVSRVSSETVDRDVVIAQAPEPGSPLERGDKINLLVSTGKKAQPFVMPKLTGKKAEEAVKIVERMGLQHRVITKASTTWQQAGDRIVVSQKPTAGYPAAPDVTVDIVVSK